MEKFSNAEGYKIVFNLIDTIHSNREFLSEVDGAIGDGDHGINMDKGFSLAKLKISEDMNLSASLDTLGNMLLSEIGGSIGPLYGLFFKSLSSSCNSKEEIDKYIFLDMLKNAYTKITEIGNAKVGDKTLIDTLYPAYNAYKGAVDNKTFRESLEIMIQEAEKGKDSTRDLVAKIGRSSRLGERSKGALDAGAVSCYLILKSITESIIKILNNK